MQGKYNTKIGLGKTLLIGCLVGVMGTVSGCGSTGEKIRVSQKNSDMRYLQNIANKYGKLSLCDASGWEEYPRIQAYIDKTYWCYSIPDFLKLLIGLFIKIII